MAGVAGGGGVEGWKGVVAGWLRFRGQTDKLQVEGAKGVGGAADKAQGTVSGIS